MLHTKSPNELTVYEKKLKEYYWKCFISEFSKVLIFLTIFALLDLLPEYLIALLSLIPLRNHGGGLHCKHYLSCLLVSFSFLSASIFFATYLVPSKSFIFISTLTCALIGYCLVPITSRNRPPATFEQCKKSKKNTTIIILFFLLLLCICPHNTYLYICYWTVILHIFQLIIGYSIKEVKNNVWLGN